MTKIVKQAKADIYLRDTDSQSLFNNSGVLSFKYFHEWNDCYNSVTGETAQIDGEVYDEETGAYKPNCPEGYSPVFNGRLSALWDNMVSCFPDKIQSMYKTMRDNGLSYKDMLSKYKEFWRYWCENLYNADAFGYANTNNFTKAYGDKMMIMDFFFQKRQRYLDSKYCCGSSASNNLRLRLYETGKGLAIKYYQAIYSSLQWGANNFSTKRNINPGTYSYMPFSFSNPQDATFDIDDADLITELSTYTRTSSGYTITGFEGLGDFKFDLNMGLLKRLTKFIMNYTVAKPNTKEQGDNFDMSGMKMLRQVIVRNVKNLTKSIVITSDLVEEIDFTNTPIVSLTTPPSDALTKLVLPASIMSLKLKGYTNLQPSGLQIAGYSNIDEFEVEDCPNLDALALLTECYKANAPLSEVSLKGIDWTLDSMDLLMYLAQKKANLQGKITISDTVIVSLTQKLQLMAAFGNIDDKDNSLYISYSSYEIKSVSIIGKGYLTEKGQYTFEAKTSPSNGNNATDFIWSISENDFATINQSGVLTLNKVGSKENGDKATITLTVTLSDGSTLEATKEVNFFKKDCELGDYLFADGSYGNSLNDSTMSPVGVIFYLEPVQRRYALAVALEDIKYKRSWGLCNLGSDSISNIILNDSISSVYDIQEIDNIISSGTSRIEDLYILDSQNIYNDGFKAYQDTTACGDIGLVEITPSLYQILSGLLYDIGLNKGDMISKGQLKTLKIINHRNTVLQDSSINLPIPKASLSETEEDSLIKNISTIVSTHNNQSKYEQYYYSAASNCFAYSPKIKKGEKLADNLKPHHWFLPSIGELMRIQFFQNHSKDGSDKLGIFFNSKNDYVYSNLINYPYISSTENAESKIWSLSNSTYVNDPGLKSVFLSVRPIVTIKIN